MSRDLQPRTPPARLRYGPSTLARAKVVARRPGRRSLIAYRVERRAEDGRYVLAKHFRDPAQAMRVYGILEDLQSMAIGAPRPIDVAPERSLLLYRPVDGFQLSDLILSDPAGSGLRRAADWLAQLHGSSIRLDRVFDVEREVANLGRWAKVVAESKPRAASPALALFEDLQVLAREMPLTTDVPVHKDFHHGHVIVGPSPASVDVDEMRYGDPSLDLAHFCVHLWLLGVRGRRRMRELERLFLDRYASRTGWRTDERFSYFSAYTCLKIAKQLCNGAGVAPLPTGPELDRELALVLRRGRRLAAGIP